VAWLPTLAGGVAWVACVRPVIRRRAQEYLTLALGIRRPVVALRLLRESAVHHTTARLCALHPRDESLARVRALVRAAPWRTERPAPLLLSTRFGGAVLALAALAAERVPRADLDELPRRAEDAGWIPWLGRITAVDLGAVRKALAERRGVRLFLVLPDGAGWTPWWSPDLASMPGDAGATAERALRALEVLVRAAPHLWDWTWPRWALRPEREVDGHATSSRLAPWLNPRRRAGRRARRGR
jgi:hypothetical protein